MPCVTAPDIASFCIEHRAFKFSYLYENL